MRFPVLPAVLVATLAAAAPAFAQETQQEIVDRLFREENARRQSTFTKVAGAPDRAFNGMQNGSSAMSLGIGSDSAKPAPPKAAPKPAPERRFPWTLVALVVLPIGWITWKAFVRLGRQS